MHGVFLLFTGLAQATPACTPSPAMQAELRRLSGAQANGALGYWFIEQKNLPCAIAAFRSAVKLDPSSIESQYNLGVALAESGDIPGAAEHLRAAARLKAGDLNIQSALDQVEKEVTTLAAGHLQKAARMIQAGQRDQAIVELRAALQLKADSAEALGNLGVLMQQQGKSAEAEKLFVRAVGANPRDPQHLINLGLTMAEQKRYTEAVTMMDKALALAPESPAALTAKGMILLRQQQRDQAIETFRRVLSMQPGSTQAHTNLGIALADSERQAEALASFDEALRLAPGFAPARLNRGRALYDLKRYDEAQADLSAVLQLMPNDMQAIYRLGLAEARLNQPAKAAELLQKVVTAEPKNSIAQQELGQVFIELGRAKEGEAHLRQAIKLDPNNSQAAYALMRVLSSRGSAEAAQFGQRVRELKKEELSVTQARAYSNFGLDAAKEKEWSKAIENLRKAVDTCGACIIQAALRRNLGLVLAQSGDAVGAIAELQNARKLDPADQDVQYALQVLRGIKAKP